MDELCRHLELLLRDPLIRGRDPFERAQLVGEVELLEDEDAVVHAERAQMPAVAHHERDHGGEPRLLHRLREQRVDVVAAVARADVVRLCEEERIDVLARDEVGDLDRAVGAGGAGELEVLVGHLDELALAELEGLDHLVVGHRLALELADLLVPDRACVGLVDQVELELVLGDRRVHLHGHADEPERDDP